MKNFNNFILEKKINKIDPDEIYTKYYSDLDSDVFYKIIKADPTSTIDGKVYVGKYSKWLLKLFKEKNLKLEDLYKATEYLKIFDKESVRNKLTIDQKNINNYLKLSDLAELVLPFKEDKSILSKSEIKEDNLVAEFKNYKLYIPKTFKDSCILGKGTEWCTATEKTDEYYKQYHKPGRELLIFINKKDNKKKYQLHLRTQQFMNKLDQEMDLENFLFKNKDIKDWLEKNYAKEYKRYFNDESIFSLQSYLDLGSPEIVEGTYYCSGSKLKTLKGGPKIVEGTFSCSRNELTTLEGGPEKVEGDFFCTQNQLITLEGCPKHIEGDFNCNNNELTTLNDGPKIVDGNYYCASNKLITLKNAPEISEAFFDCSHNQLKTLKGCPRIIYGSFYCTNNQLITLEGCPENIRNDFNCNNNQLTTLEGGPKIVEGYFICNNNQLINLKGCPDIIGGDFSCNNNYINTLKYFPTTVFGNFICFRNNIPPEEIEELKKSGKVKGKIITE